MEFSQLCQFHPLFVKATLLNTDDHESDEQDYR